MFNRDGLDMISRFVKLIREEGATKAANKAFQYITSRPSLRPQIQYFKYKIRYGAAAPNPHEIIFVSPDEINKLVTPRFRELDRNGTYIRGGEWDIRECTHELMLTSHHSTNQERRCVYPIQDYALFQSSKKHFIDGVPWEETEFFQWMESKSDPALDDYKSGRFDDFDKLYKKIVTNGYKTQSKLKERCTMGKWEKISDRLTPNDEILVNIGRNGDIFLDDGRHRLIISKLLSLNRVPVRPFVRHTEWQNKRQTVAEEGINNVGPELKSHPDIKNVRSSVDWRNQEY